MLLRLGFSSLSGNFSRSPCEHFWNFALKEQTIYPVTLTHWEMDGAWSGLEFTSHRVTTGHSAAAAAAAVPSRWMAASREHLRRPSRRGSIPSQDPETQMSYETPGTSLHVELGWVGGRGQRQRFCHGGAVMGWDSQPAATTRFLMRCPVKKSAAWTWRAAAEPAAGFGPRLRPGQPSVWAHDN